MVLIDLLQQEDVAITKYQQMFIQCNIKAFVMIKGRVETAGKEGVILAQHCSGTGLLTATHLHNPQLC